VKKNLVFSVLVHYRVIETFRFMVTYTTKVCVSGIIIFLISILLNLIRLFLVMWSCSVFVRLLEIFSVLGAPCLAVDG
jgi:hypothetical protein